MVLFKKVMSDMARSCFVLGHEGLTINDFPSLSDKGLPLKVVTDQDYLI